METTNYSQEAIAVVEECIEMFDVEGLVKHAVYYISAYHCTILDYVLENIEDWQELTQEEMQYLSQRVQEFMDKYL
jgi:hypothetical protein